MEIRIGSFNMNNFGGSSNKDFGKIAEIIVEENLDVVALQEIFSEGRGVSRLLEQNVKYELYNWDYCFAAPSESRDITKMEDMVVKKTRSEGYAFLWKKSRFKKVEFSKLGETRRFEPRIINSLSKDVCVDCSFFARAPYYIRLQPIHGGFFELRLVNVHIFFGDTKLSSIEKRQAEYAVLTQQIYPEICQNTYGQNRTPYTVAMGDYNLNLFNPLVNTQSKNCYIMELFFCILLHRPRVIGQRRARPYNGHIADNNIDELRKLINAGRPNQLSHLCHARVALPTVNTAAGVLRTVRHRAELIDGEDLSMQPQPLLLEQHRPRRGQPDRKRREKQYG